MYIYYLVFMVLEAKSLKFSLNLYWKINKVCEKEFLNCLQLVKDPWL